MKRLFSIFLVCVINTSLAQSNEYNCFVRYHVNYFPTNDYYMWTNGKNCLYLFEANKQAYLPFAVYDKGWFTTTDTVKYYREYIGNVEAVKKSFAEHPKTYFILKIDSSKLYKIHAGLNKYDTVYTEDTLPDLKWRLTNDTAMILGRLCQKGVLVFNNQEFEGWYDPTIPINGGPKNYRGLPGLILRVTSKDKKIDIIAEEINLPPLIIKKYTDKPAGKKVTKTESDLIFEKLSTLSIQGQNPHK
jgi:GLPGLI family protein